MKRSSNIEIEDELILINNSDTKESNNKLIKG